MKKIANNHYYNDLYFKDVLPHETVTFFPKENGEFPLFVYEKFLSEKLVNLLEKKMLLNQSGKKLGTGKVFEDQNYNEDIRNTYYIPVNDEVKDLYDKRFNLIKEEIESFYGINILEGENLQAMGYDKGCRFLYHSDNSSFSVRDDGYIYNWKIEKSTRVLSTILFLTDQVDEISGEQQCTGGDVSFCFITDPSGKFFSFRPKKGTLIAFPSNAFYTHQVNDVTGGFRISLVNWYNASLKD